MRAPPASNRPTIGARAFIAMSWIFWIFSAWVSESEPPNTVKSLANTNIVWPIPLPGLTTLSLARELGNLAPSSPGGIVMAQRHAGAVEGMPRLVLRLEGAALALAALYAYHRVGASWWLFAALILVPDVS